MTWDEVNDARSGDDTNTVRRTEGAAAIASTNHVSCRTPTITTEALTARQKHFLNHHRVELVDFWRSWVADPTN
jgi:hypothetical protein